MPPTPPHFDDRWEFVTPQKAADLLAQGTEHERALSPDRVRQYAHYMTEGRWDVSVASRIEYTGDGRRRNGQHRLQAVLRASGADPSFGGIWMEFRHGIAAGSVKYIDIGQSRSRGHRLAQQGISDVNVYAAILGRAVAWDAGFRMPGFYRTGGEADVEAEEAYRLAHHSELTEAVAFGTHITSGRTPRTASSSIYGFAYYLLSRLDQEEARDYLTKLALGEGIYRGSAVWVARDNLLSLREGKRTKVLGDVMLYYIVAGWILQRSNPTARRSIIRLPYDSRTKEFHLTRTNFPDPI